MVNINEATCVKSQGLISEAGVKFHILFINCSLEDFMDLVFDSNVQSVLKEGKKVSGIMKTSCVVCQKDKVFILKTKSLQLNTRSMKRSTTNSITTFSQNTWRRL